MRTPKEYLDNLKNGIVTEIMLSDVLYSYSKRAKNYRDRIREYNEKICENGAYYDKYYNIDNYETKKNEYYNKKSDILKHYDNKVTIIHKLTFKHRKRVYDYDKEWVSLEEERIKYKKDIPSKVVWMNNYFDEEDGEYVEFCDTMQSKKRYFLYYELGKHSFHRPIDASELREYKSIEVVELQELKTYGEDIKDLLSVQFCDKVWKFIMNKGEIN